MNHFKKSAMGLSVMTAAVLLFAYQNCSRTQFVSSLDGANLKAVDIVDSSGRTEGDDGQTGAPVPGDSVDVPPVAGASPSPAPVPDMSPAPSVPPVMPPVVVDDPKGNGKGGDNAGGGMPSEPPAGSPSGTPAGSPSDSPTSNVGGNKDGDKVPPGQSAQLPDLVECQMLHPNKKVVLEVAMQVQHGNSSAIRICMSTNACLNLINQFAVKHSCSLDASAPEAAADAQAQCTEIFPGSRGTCKNATILSDAQVSELLVKLAAPAPSPSPVAPQQ